VVFESEIFRKVERLSASEKLFYIGQLELVGNWQIGKGVAVEEMKRGGEPLEVRAFHVFLGDLNLCNQAHLSRK
jgi:hypothetical protein